ncbi:DR1-associated corepressor-like protein isoform X1 [Tanacetum coccineum]
MEACVTRALSLKAFMSLEHCSPSRLQKSSNSDLVPDTSIVQRNPAANGEELIAFEGYQERPKDFANETAIVSVMCDRLRTSWSPDVGPATQATTTEDNELAKTKLRIKARIKKIMQADEDVGKIAMSLPAAEGEAILMYAEAGVVGSLPV